MPSSVEVCLGAESYKPLEVPDGCTVEHFRELLEGGHLGKPVMYSFKLKISKQLTGTVLAEEEALPLSPERLDVHGPASVMGMLEIALRHRLGPPTLMTTGGEEVALDAWDEVCRALGAHSAKDPFDFWGPADFERVQQLARRPEPDDQRPPPKDRKDRLYLQVGEEVAGYSVVRRLGEGFTGVVYLTENVDDSSKVALKWPLRPSELAAWRLIQRRAGIVPGLPLLLGSGDHAGQPYAMTDLLGWDLSMVLKTFKRHPLRKRWSAVKVIGRMVLRRLEALHRIGFVHCDVSPFNVLFGRARGFRAQESLTLYLIDFGLAQAFPGGPPLAASDGTAEFTSVRTSAGLSRVPEDDLEALGWIMLWLLHIGLPWAEDELEEDHVAKACAAKKQLLLDGWSSFPGTWAKLADTPQELRRFLAACRWQDLAPVGLPDYSHLQTLLGGRVGLDWREAEEEDAREWRVRVVPLL